MVRIRYSFNELTGYHESQEILCSEGFVLACYKEDENTHKTMWEIVSVDGGHIPIEHGETSSRQEAIGILKTTLVSLGAHFQDEIRKRKEK